MHTLSRTALVAAMASALASPSAPAAVFQVTSSADSGPGSLRQALIDAASNMEPDTLDLSSISGQTIVLTSGELSIYLDDVVIDGAGVTVDARQNSRVLRIGGSTATLNDLVLTGGNAFGAAGGGIFAGKSRVTLNDVELSFNEATVGGGLAANTVDIDINRSAIHSNESEAGGGAFIYLANFVDIVDTTITGNQVIETGTRDRFELEFDALFETESGNEAPRGDSGPAGLDFGDGGGVQIQQTGPVRIIRSTVADNTASRGGGAFIVSKSGSLLIDGSTISGNVADVAGGLQGVTQGTVRVINSTISSNTASSLAGGAALASGSPGAPGAVELVFSTVVGNSAGSQAGGLFVTSQVSPNTLVGAVIAGNTAPTDPDLSVFADGGSLPVDVRDTLIGIDPATGTLNKDPVSIALTGQAPELAPLGNAGGPTRTHVPRVGSPLLDVVPNGEEGCGIALLFDQRGESRPQNGACDLGAVEGSIAPLPPARAVPTLDRFGLWLMVGLIGLAGGLARRTATGERPAA